MFHYSITELMGTMLKKDLYSSNLNRVLERLTLFDLGLIDISCQYLLFKQKRNLGLFLSISEIALG